MVDLVVDCLRSRSSLDQLKGVWQALECADDQCTPFASWVWADGWWREFGLESDRLRILIVRNGKEVVGLCPLYRRTTRHYRFLSVTTLALLGAVPGIQAVHPGVIAQPRFRKLSEIAIMQHLPKLKGWDTLDLNALDVDSSFAALARDKLRTERGVVAEELTSQIDEQTLQGSWNEFLATDDGLRALELKRLGKKFMAVGFCELSLTSTRHDLADSQDKLYSLNRQPADTRNTPDNSVATQQSFFKGVVSELFVAHMLWQLTLHIDGQVVAVQHYFLWRGDLLLFQSASASELDELDVAKYLLAYAIKRGMGQSFGRVRIHCLPSGFAHPFVAQSACCSQLRFTPSGGNRLVAKVLKIVDKANYSKLRV